MAKKSPPAAPPPALFEGDHPTPSRIDLVESSGPVSPPHQFYTRLVVEAEGDALSLVIDDERGWEGGAFRQKIRRREVMPRADYEALWSDLLALDALALGADLIGAEGRRMVGVAFNHLLLRLGDREARIDYRLRDLSRSKFAPQARVVERVRRLLPGD
jgi:hypothetical protein